MKIRTLIATLILMMSYSFSSFAAEIREFSNAALETAQAEGRPVVVDVGAWWCPVCMTQKSRLKKVVSEAEYDKLLVLSLSWTSQKDEWKKLGVTQRGTLIAFHGKEERSRLVFDTNKEKITALAQSALKN